MGGGDGGAWWTLKKAAMKIFVQTCCTASFCNSQQQQQQTHVSRDSCNNHSSSSLENIQKMGISSNNVISSEIGTSNKNLCAICLDPLNYTSVSSRGQAIFTAQCSHAFHFACISSNVRHGSVTCPICRAHWTQLPRKLNNRCPLHNKKQDPVLRILDDSIANFRVRRRSFMRSRYDDDNDDDDEPVEPDRASVRVEPRLSFSLLAYTSFNSCPHQDSRSNCGMLSHHSPNNGAYLRVRLEHQPATDLVLVVSHSGAHLRFMKQAMCLVVSSLRPIDRLAIVTYSHVCTLRRMNSYGKRTTLQVINRLLHNGQVDHPMDELKKGVKILEDCVHKNIHSCILHLTDSTLGSHHWLDPEVPVTIHLFQFGFGFSTCNGLIMREFEEFLARTLGGGVEDIHLRIGDRTMVVKIGELRGGEERNIPLCVGESGRVLVKYSYREGGDGECVRTGEIVVGMENDDKGDRIEIRDEYDIVPMERRLSSAGNWDYHDPFLARRWAKHFHGYRL